MDFSLNRMSSTQNEIERQLKGLLIKCVKRMYSTGIISWDSLEEYRKDRMAQ